MEIKVLNMSRKENGCVTQVSILATLEKNGYSAEHNFTTGIPMKDPSESGFIPYEDLTEEIVEGWFTSDDLLLLPVKEQLEKSIDAQQTPPSINGLPW